VGYFEEHIVDVLDVFSELNNIGIVINLLESIQKMLGNIRNSFDLRFINVIIISHLLPAVHHTQVAPSPLQHLHLRLQPAYYIPLLQPYVSLPELTHTYIDTHEPSSPTAPSLPHKAASSNNYP